MNRFILILVCFFTLSTYNSVSQDIIRYVDGGEIKAKIIATTDDYVIVKDISSELKDTIPYFELKEIQFRSGKIVKYTDPNKVQKEYELRSFAISLEPFMFITSGMLWFNFEYFINDKISLNVPVAKEFGATAFFTGVDIRYYLNNPKNSIIYLGPLKLGKGNFKYFIAPGFLYQKDGMEYTRVKDKDLPYFGDKYNKMALSFTLGSSLILTNGFYFSFYIGAAPSIVMITNDIMLDPILAISFGYRFTKRVK